MSRARRREVKKTRNEATADADKTISNQRKKYFTAIESLKEICKDCFDKKESAVDLLSKVLLYIYMLLGASSDRNDDETPKFLSDVIVLENNEKIYKLQNIPDFLFEVIEIYNILKARYHEVDFSNVDEQLAKIARSLKGRKLKCKEPCRNIIDIDSYGLEKEIRCPVCDRKIGDIWNGNSLTRNFEEFRENIEKELGGTRCCPHPNTEISGYAGRNLIVNEGCESIERIIIDNGNGIKAIFLPDSLKRINGINAFDRLLHYEFVVFGDSNLSFDASVFTRNLGNNRRIFINASDEIYDRLYANSFVKSCIAQNKIEIIKKGESLNV